MTFDDHKTREALFDCAVDATHDRIASKFGCAVLLVHHSTKSTEQKTGSRTLRGHGSLFGALDVSAFVRLKDADAKLIEVNLTEKMKDGEPLDRLLFRLKKVALGNTSTGKSKSSCVLELVSSGLQAKAAAQPDTYEAAILKAFKSSKSLDRKSLIACLPDDKKSPAAKDQALTRALARLKAKGLLAASARGFHVWIGADEADAEPTE